MVSPFRLRYCLWIVKADDAVKNGRWTPGSLQSFNHDSLMHVSRYKCFFHKRRYIIHTKDPHCGTLSMLVKLTFGRTRFCRINEPLSTNHVTKDGNFRVDRYIYLYIHTENPAIEVHSWRTCSWAQFESRRPNILCKKVSRFEDMDILRIKVADGTTVWVTSPPPNFCRPVTTFFSQYS